MNPDEGFKCLTSVNETSYIFNHFLELVPDSMSKILYSMDDQKGLNFYNYIFLRKVNLAFDNCS